MSTLIDKFDDVVSGEYGKWSQVCDGHAKELNIPSNLLDEGAGHGICGVIGCNKESDHYIDF